MEETGAIGEVADGIASITDGNRTAKLLGITWVSALALGACFGGKATLIAAAANVVILNARRPRR